MIRTLLLALLLVVAAHGRQKGLRQDHSIFDQISGIEYQAAAPRLAMQHGQSVGQSQHPGGGGA